MTPAGPDDEVARREAEDREGRIARLRYMLYAERVTRILCRRSGAVPGYSWRAPPASARGEAATYLRSHRVPPLPFHQVVHKGFGSCRVCGQPVYGAGGRPSGAGTFRSFAGPVSIRLTWHNVCLSTYFLMTKPSDYAELLIERQDQVCAISGARIRLPYNPNEVDVDHAVPLFRVARDHAGEPWYELIRFWGFGNLRAVTHAAHLRKCADEARERSGLRDRSGAEAML